MQKPECDYDVIVAGGGAGGVGATLGAAQARAGFACREDKFLGGGADLVLDELRKLFLVILNRPLPLCVNSFAPDQPASSAMFFCEGIKDAVMGR